MKKSRLIPLLTSIPLLVTSVMVGTKPNKVVAGSGDYAQSDLPTTINLNDYKKEDIRGYYSSLNSKSESELRGDNLLKNLKPILKNNQKYYSYDKGSGSTNSIWKAYEITDRDWTKSPAKDIPGYDEATNTITGYKYNNSDPYVRALYVDRSIDNPKTAWDEHAIQSDERCIQREHIWPKSHGFDKEKSGSESSGARGDLMHLWAADGGANVIHNNFFYGNVDKTRSYTTSKTNYTWTGDNLLGNPKRFSTSNVKVFEPQDSDKGDIARAVFYMVARYNNIAGTDNSIDSSNPNLCLTNDASKSEETGTSSATVAYALGIMDDLLEWNKKDPVDEYEIHRNNLLQRNFTNNRNPFIDFPDWAEVIWGSKKTEGKADPVNDELFQGSEYIEPEDPEIISPDHGPLFVYGAIAVGVVVLIIIIVVATKGSKKQKKALKKAIKSTVKPAYSSKKKSSSTRKSSSSKSKKK